MAIAMLSTQPPGSLLTCNGYKDTEYMELVRIPSRVVRQCFPSKTAAVLVLLCASVLSRSQGMMGMPQAAISWVHRTCRVQNASKHV